MAVALDGQDLRAVVTDRDAEAMEVVLELTADRRRVDPRDTDPPAVDARCAEPSSVGFVGDDAAAFFE